MEAQSPNKQPTARPTKFWENLAGMLSGAAAVFLLVTLRDRGTLFPGFVMLIASMGASAVLIFGIPHSVLARPWPVLAGHTVSALLGVLCAKYISSEALAAACAVGLSIGAMHRLRCIHPPGGATALGAVIGGPAIREMGLGFVWNPVFLNALVLVCAGLLYHRLIAHHEKKDAK